MKTKKNAKKSDDARKLLSVYFEPGEIETIEALAAKDSEALGLKVSVSAWVRRAALAAIKAANP